MFSYEADEHDTKELSKVEYFISFCLVSYAHVFFPGATTPHWGLYFTTL